jgi:membrane protein
MHVSFSATKKFSKKLASEWSSDKVSKKAASLAYYTVFSMAPLLVIMIAIAGFFFAEDAARGQIVGQLAGILGQSGAQLVQSMIQNTQKHHSGIIATVLGVVLLISGAAGVFSEIQDSLNMLWQVEHKSKPGLWGLIHDRLLTFGMVIAMGFLLTVSLVVSTALQAAAQKSGVSATTGFIGEAVNFVVSLLVIGFVFAMVLKFLPDIKLGWSDVWRGALFTSILFAIGKTIIGLYLGHAGVTSTFGAAGSVVVILLWVYYTSQILYTGAVFTKIYAHEYGSMRGEEMPERETQDNKKEKTNPSRLVPQPT